jgi:hypothetical protein
LVGTPGKKSFKRPRSIWKDNIKTDIKEIRYKTADRLQLAQDCMQWQDLVNTVIIPSGSTKNGRNFNQLHYSP